VKQQPARQFNLFESPHASAAIPKPIEEEVVALLAQMLEAMICGAGSRTGDGDEQDYR